LPSQASRFFEGPSCSSRSYSKSSHRGWSMACSAWIEAPGHRANDPGRARCFP
jgi:hypothetical protein